MSPSEVFAMLRERLSHSLIDGRLLTAAGPSGENGLRRLLRDRFVLEELTGRLLGLFHVGEHVLGMDASSSAFQDRRARAERLAATIGDAAGVEENSFAPTSLRALLIEIRGLLSEMAGDRGSYSVLQPDHTRGRATLFAHIEVLSRLIARALRAELSMQDAEHLAREYWTARMDAEEEAIAVCMHLANGMPVVSNSLEDVLWMLRSFDDIAGIAMAAGIAPTDKLSRSEIILGGSVAGRLAELAASATDAIGCSKESEN